MKLAAIMIALAAATPANADCVQLNTSSPVGYVNVRSAPDHRAPILGTVRNTGSGSGIGNLQFCGRWHKEGKTLWLYVRMHEANGTEHKGWVSRIVVSPVLAGGYGPPNAGRSEAQPDFEHGGL
jgi:hypothetical protein